MPRGKKKAESNGAITFSPPEPHVGAGITFTWEGEGDALRIDAPGGTTTYTVETDARKYTGNSHIAGKYRASLFNGEDLVATVEYDVLP